MKIERKKEGKQLKRCQKDREMFQLSSKKGCVKEEKKRKKKTCNQVSFLCRPVSNRPKEENLLTARFLFFARKRF